MFVFEGITAVICTYPLDMVRARLAFQVKGDHKYTGIIHAFKTIYTKVIVWGIPPPPLHFYVAWFGNHWEIVFNIC